MVEIIPFYSFDRSNMSSKKAASQVIAGATRLGYGRSGIKSGPAGAEHMASTAKSHGGKVPSGSTVSQLQSAGSKAPNQSASGGGKKK